MESNTSDAPVKKLQTPEEVAHLIAWHPESVRRAIRAGRIKAKRFGRGWRIMPDEIARLMAEGIPQEVEYSK